MTLAMHGLMVLGLVDGSANIVWHCMSGYRARSGCVATAELTRLHAAVLPRECFPAITDLMVCGLGSRSANVVLAPFEMFASTSGLCCSGCARFIEYSSLVLAVLPAMRGLLACELVSGNTKAFWCYLSGCRTPGGCVDAAVLAGLHAPTHSTDTATNKRHGGIMASCW